MSQVHLRDCDNPPLLSLVGTLVKTSEELAQDGRGIKHATRRFGELLYCLAACICALCAFSGSIRFIWKIDAYCEVERHNELPLVVNRIVRSCPQFSRLLVKELLCTH
jgi:hypothetical protein